MAVPVLEPYRRVRDAILDGYVLLYRHPRCLTSDVIATSSRSIYSHIGVAGWWEDDLFCLQTREHFGGHPVLLSREVQNAPGRIDVYRPNVTPEQRHQIMVYMRRAAGQPYGWGQIAAHVWRSLPVVRWFAKTPLDDEEDYRKSNSPPVCSSLTSAAFRFAGVDLVLNLADSATTPGDIGRSAVLVYQFTLDWDGEAALPLCSSIKES